MTIGRCYGIAVAELRLQPSEFWRMSPRQLADALAVMRQRRKEDVDLRLELEKRADHRAAIIACKMHNMWRGEDSPSLRPWDIYPWLEPAPQSDEEITEAFVAFRRRHNAQFLEA